MGVLGLWKLIDESGKNVPVDLLENKVLAIDISIWLHQVIKGFQDNKGSPLANAHLLGLFNRLCKLLFYRIKPIFVFDGGVPALKRDTIAKRNENKSKYMSEAERIQHLLFTSLAKEKIVQQALGASKCEALISPSKQQSKKIQLANKQAEKDEIFKLPAIPEENFVSEELESSDSSFDEHNYYNDLKMIDIESTHFKSLPVDTRLEILTEIKETRKHSSWNTIHELPVENDQFCSFQMKRLLKRFKVQKALDETEKEIGSNTLSLDVLEGLINDDDYNFESQTNSGQLLSNENRRYILIRDLKNASKENKIKSENIDEKELAVPSTSTSIETNQLEEDEDLKKAIELSLKDEGNLCDNDQDANINDLKLSEKQKTIFNSAIDKLARGYLMEYAGLSSDDVKELMTSDSRNKSNLQKPIDDELESVSSNADSDFVDVPDDDFNTSDMEIFPVNPMIPDLPDNNDMSRDFRLKDLEKPKIIEITVNPFETDLKDDIFKDTFDEIENENSKIDHTDQKTYLNDDTKKIATKSDVTEILEELKKEKSEVLNIKLDNLPTLEGMNKNLDQINNDLLDNLCTHSANSSSVIFLDDQEKPIEIMDDSDSNSTIIDSELHNIERSPKKPDVGSLKKKLEISLDCDTPPIKLQRISSNENLKPKENPEDHHVPVDECKKPQESKAVKKLFFTPQPNESNEKPTVVDKPCIPEDEVILLEDEFIKTASENLKNKSSQEELEKFMIEIARDKHDLEVQQNKNARLGASISEQMSKECMELLKLFGVPYIIAPMEAEAQCAFLNHINLTDGTITDDSDIWLFGGETVYKNFFNQKKSVLEFRMDRIEKLFNIDRKKMIQIAMLVGSDYTSGISGIGAVTALEVLASFPSTAVGDGTTETMSILSGLRKFREWLKCEKSSGKCALKKKLKNIEITSSFPSIEVVEAYLNPRVDDNRSPFTWGYPNVEAIHEFTKKNFGWTRLKTEEILNPVLKKISDRNKQSSIKDYFKIQSSPSLRKLKLSKRVQNAIEKMSVESNREGNQSPTMLTKKCKKKKEKQKESANKDEEKTIPTSSRTTRNKKNNSKQSEIDKESDKKTEKNKKERKTIKKSTEPQLLPSSSESPIFKRLHSTHQTEIPQKKKEKEEMMNNKLKAIEIFKKSSTKQ